jgi:hypothetical protein
LAHEYWHYLQNISTFSGYESFRIDQGLVVLFSKTLIPAGSGESAGGSVLSEQDRGTVSDLSARILRDAGEKGPPGRVGQPVESRVCSVDGPRVEVEVSKRGTVVGAQSFVLGTVVIEESVAWLVESLIAQTPESATNAAVAMVVAASDASAGDVEGGGPLGATDFAEVQDVPVPEAPEFPYRVLERLAEYIVGGPVPPSIIAGLGTLALLTDRPGSHLERILRMFAAALNRGYSALAALRAVVDCQRAAIQAFVDGTDSVLAEIETMHHGRGLSEKAARDRVAEYRRALRRRARAPLFDIEIFLTPSDGCDPDGLRAHLGVLFEDFPPCDILVRDPEGVDEMLTAGLKTDKHGLQSSQYARSFEAQRHFMRAHLSVVEGEFVPSMGRVASCPFASSCTHPLKVRDGALCENAPWRQIHSPGAGAAGCWYTNGVNATMGTVRFTKTLDD